MIIKPNAFISQLQMGLAPPMAGDVTQLNSLIGLAPSVLEEQIGFERGRLRSGWYLLTLDERVERGEFLWGAKTDYSGGTDPARIETWEEKKKDGTIRIHNERIPIHDLKRYDLYKKSNFDEASAEKHLSTFLDEQLKMLNVRTGAKRIVKVVPVVEHDKNKGWSDQYPDAPPGQGMKQWKLTKKKKFIVTCFVGVGRAYT